MNKKTKITFLITSIVIFIISLFRECYVIQGQIGEEGMLGIIAFLLGWMNPSQSLITWFANPFYILAIILLFGNKYFALISAIIAFGLAMSFQFFDEVIIDEGGTVGIIYLLSSGYWLWLASIGLILITTLLNLKTVANSR